jgi:hypothetical protein
MNDEHDPRLSRSLEELVLRYWDNALSSEELRELNQALGSSEHARVSMQQLCLQALLIGEQFAVEKAGAGPAATRGGGWWSVKAWGWIAPAVVAASLLLAALAVPIFRKPPEVPTPQEPTDIARLEGFTGSVRVSPGDGAPARLGQPLRSGQTVTVAGVDGAAEVRFPDGTRLVLNGDSAVQIADDGQKKIRVDCGNLAADVRPQPPGRPMVLTTPEAEVQVLGTKLALSETTRKTEVAVVQGEVTVTRLSDGKSVAVRRGELATAVKGGEDLLLQKLAALPDTYAVNFGRLPLDWGAGELAYDALPPGSRVGMRAAACPSDRFGAEYQIVSQKAWTSGLFVLHEDSWLHMRFQVDKPGFFHVLFVARLADPTTDKRGVVFEAPHFWEHREPGRWYEVSVPLGGSKRLNNPPPELKLPLVAFLAIVSSQATDLGLTIDRLRVTRGPHPD